MALSNYKQPFKAAIDSIGNATAKDQPHLVTGVDESARATLIAQLYETYPQPILIVEPRANQLNELVGDLTELLPDAPLHVFPEEESLAVEYSVASFDNTAARVDALNFLASGKPGIVVTSVQGIRKSLSPLSQWRQANEEIAIGDEYERSDLEKRFMELGYRRESMVMSPGEFSVRGSIIDFYPLNSEYPVRLDFFDVDLDSIRYFDAETQESIENIDSVLLSPATDIIFTVEQQQAILPQLEKRLKKATNAMQDKSLALQVTSIMGEQLNLLEDGEPLKYATAYLNLSDSKGTSIIDYLDSEGLFIVNEYAQVQQRQHTMIEENQFWVEQEIQKGQLLPNLDIKLNVYDIIPQAEPLTVYFSVLQRGFTKMTFAAVHNYQYRSMNQFFNQMPLVKSEMDQWLHSGSVIQVLVHSKKQAQNTQELFEEYEIHPVVIQDKNQPQAGVVNIHVGTLARGFELPVEKWVVLTENELFENIKRTKQRVRTPKMSNAERIKSYNELNVGDFVVHVDHGIGKYTGLETLEIDGAHRDLLAIEYEDQARVLIPVEKVHSIQKYVASESKTPKLNKLGGTAWAKTKQKVQATIEDIADQLIELYAIRSQAKGYAFGPDTPEQAEFENAFNYVETPDQLQSASEIKEDMEKDRPMDRLLIGDVGYGKTEVAMRAIFKAVMDGKQVAFLVPTTILAQQHYNTLTERFADWPFEIGMLSRFVSKANQKQTIEGLKNGSINIVVGTHRVLSNDIEFQDLGLLIVDEEQRFGVKHKERLKRLKSQVDVLTLTATPIPRTLHMSMIGVRDLSVIETPPNNRFPVQTYVMERNEGAIKSGIEREMARGGQVFYLYNRVSTIYQKADEISDIVPNARVAVAHGQMNETELENVLVEFIQGQYDVLVTTTIIETGVDIPNANTLFIDHADKMGLSTLYQLRGRVGRTHRIAYAYLMYDPAKQLSEVSEKRLNSIREFTELGSGFKIAMRDLSIRGAGNLLGQQQSGFIDSVGYDLYTQMLKEAVDRKRGEDKKDQRLRTPSIEINVNVDAYLPATYIPDDRQKINMYKAIQQIDSDESYRELQDQMIDRFGEFPDEVADLLDIALIKHYSSNVGIEQIKEERQTIVVTFNEEASRIFQGPNIFEALQDIPLKAEIKTDQNKLSVILSIYRKESYEWLSALLSFMRQAYSIVEEEHQTLETEPVKEGTE